MTPGFARSKTLTAPFPNVERKLCSKPHGVGMGPISQEKL